MDKVYDFGKELRGLNVYGDGTRGLLLMGVQSMQFTKYAVYKISNVH